VGGGFTRINVNCLRWLPSCSCDVWIAVVRESRHNVLAAVAKSEAPKVSGIALYGSGQSPLLLCRNARLRMVENIWVPIIGF